MHSDMIAPSGQQVGFIINDGDNNMDMPSQNSLDGHIPLRIFVLVLELVNGSMNVRMFTMSSITLHSFSRHNSNFPLTGRNSNPPGTHRTKLLASMAHKYNYSFKVVFGCLTKLACPELLSSLCLFVEYCSGFWVETGDNSSKSSSSSSRLLSPCGGDSILLGKLDIVCG
uniref:CACTA en-spm transposon protein n=1 Tax=Heterorhabditis bacteriophora TaxID=37862 RepID=A0A1I7WH14_HETBA